MQALDPQKRIETPTLSPTILHRVSLTTKLAAVISDRNETTSYKLVVLCAPAGYGKTTLLADVAQHANIPCCWCSLDESDADKATFLNLLIRSIRHRFPSFGKQLDALLSNALAADTQRLVPTRHIDIVLDAIVASITSEISERFALFLCNYHTVNISQHVNDLVNRLLEKLPPQCLLVVESRSIPSLDFASLLARDEIVGFDHTFLYFTPAEIQELARLQGAAPLKAKEAERLATLFGGWAAGILLGTHLGNRRILRSYWDTLTPSSLPEIQIYRQNLFAYLVNEVFSRDLEMYRFLKGVAVLREMMPTFCDALLASTDASERLQHLYRQGLFVTRSGDGTQATYTCHPVLRELLCDELRRESLSRFVALHQDALNLWQARNDNEQAIYHALEAGLDDIATQLLISAREQFIAKGRTEMLSRWIDTLLSRTHQLAPELLILRANLYLLEGEYTLALSSLTRATDVIAPQPSPDEALLLRAHISITQSKALFQAGEYVQAQSLCQQVIERVPADEITLHAEARLRLGSCANLLGNFAEGIVHLQKALQLWGRNSERYQTAELHDALGHTYILVGNLALAEHHLSRSARCWEHLQNVWGRITNFLNMGVLKHFQGEFEAAETVLRQALAMTRESPHFRRLEGYTLVNLGGLYLDQGMYSQALTVTEDGLAHGRQIGDRYLINWALWNLATIYVLMEDAETALLLLSEVHLSAASEQKKSYEKVKHELTYSLVLTRQHRYAEASTCLARLETDLQASRLQRELLQMMLRRVECQLAQGQRTEALGRINDLIPLVLRYNGERWVRQELALLPVLAHALDAMPELAPLRSILQPELAAQQKQEVPFPGRLPVEPISTSNFSVLKIVALGEPALFIDEKPITRWRIARSMELLFLLLESGSRLRKEQIITALWSEVDERVNQMLYSTIYFLRKTVGESCVISDAGVYWLDFSSRYGEHVWYDVAVFQELQAKAKKALSEENDELAKASYLAMVDLYRGDYVQSFYSDWCSNRRGELRNAYLEARHQLAQIAWRAEQCDESIIHWQQMLAVDNWSEEAHYGLMRCYARQGKRGLALRQYQRCAETLRSELAVEPGPAIQSLYQRLVARRRS